MQPFVKKYSPESSREIIGQREGIRQLVSFVSYYKTAKKKAMLIYGPSGCGKTSAAYALGKEFNYEVMELNASDLRNSDQIQSLAGSASQQSSLFNKGKIILIDDIDGIAGKQDRGGIQALAKIIDESKFPIIITANNPFDQKFNTIRKKSELIQFNELSADDIFLLIKNICDKENIKYSEDILKSLARRSSGDARGAINDLEISVIGNNNLSQEIVDELSGRNKIESILTALIRILKGTDVNIARDAFENVEEDLEKCFLWVDENLPKEYIKPEDLASAYDKLSRADVFRGRIRRWQHWRYLTYTSDLLTAGVAASKNEKYKTFVKYAPTGRILKLWWAKQRNMKKKAIAAKIAEKTHSSTRDVLQNTMPYLKVMFENGKGEQIAQEFELDNDEVEWLKKPRI